MSEMHSKFRNEIGVCMKCGAGAGVMHLPGCEATLSKRFVTFGDPAKSGGIVEDANGERFRITGSSAWVGTDGVKREMPEFERLRIDMPPSHEMGGRQWSCPACGGTERGYALRCAKCFPERSFFAEAMADAHGRMRKLIAAQVRAILFPPRAPTEDDKSVHRAISAMQKPGRANEL